MGFLKDKTAYNQVTDDNALNLFWVSVWNGSIFRTRKLKRNNLNIWRYTEVAISSAEILALGVTPKQLLPALSGQNYYKIGDVVLEYNHVTTSYTASSFISISNDLSFFYGTANILTQNADAIMQFNSFNSSVDTGNGYAYNFYSRIGATQHLSITMDDGTNPTLGDGTILVKIWYQVKTFGTEL